MKSVINTINTIFDTAAKVDLNRSGPRQSRGDNGNGNSNSNSQDAKIVKKSSKKKINKVRAIVSVCLCVCVSVCLCDCVSVCGLERI